MSFRAANTYYRCKTNVTIRFNYKSNYICLSLKYYSTQKQYNF